MSYLRVEETLDTLEIVIKSEKPLSISFNNRRYYDGNTGGNFSRKRFKRDEA